MNLTIVSPKQQSFFKLAGAVLGRLFTTPMTRRGPRYVNIGEFTPHLQRDMGFLDGRRAPGALART